MTVTPLPLYTGGQLANSEATLYTAPTNCISVVVTAATFTNTDTVNRALTVYVVRSGGSTGLANVLIDAQAITPNQAYVSPELPGVILGPGDFIAGFADVGAKVTCTGISGYVIT